MMRVSILNSVYNENRIAFMKIQFFSEFRFKITINSSGHMAIGHMAIVVRYFHASVTRRVNSGSCS